MSRSKNTSKGTNIAKRWTELWGKRPCSGWAKEASSKRICRRIERSQGKELKRREWADA